MTNWGQNLPYKNTISVNYVTNTLMYQTIVTNWWQICHYKITISVRYVTITLIHQTIVTKFVTSGTKMWQNLNPHKPRGCAVSSMWQKFCHISTEFVTCLSPFCHASKPRHINVCEGFDTKCDKIGEITNNIFIFFKKILLAIYKYLSHLCIFYV